MKIVVLFLIVINAACYVMQTVAAFRAGRVKDVDYEILLRLRALGSLGLMILLVIAFYRL